MEMNFFQEVWLRFQMPWKQGAFVGYFIFIVVLFGGVGVLASIHDVYQDGWKDCFRIAQNVGTYFMAIIAASVVDLNLSLSIKNFASLIIYSIVALAVSLVLFYWSYTANSNVAFVPACLGLVLGLVVWILANADNDKLNDSSFYSIMRGKKEGHGNNW